MTERTVINLSDWLGAPGSRAAGPGVADDGVQDAAVTDEVYDQEQQQDDAPPRAAVATRPVPPLPARPDWADSMVLADDLVGDSPFIPGWLLSPEGRRAKRAYLRRLARRRARRWLNRQRTRHGAAPRTARGIVRAHRWIHGTEGTRLRAHQHLIRELEIAARQAEREARYALRQRKAKKSNAIEQHKTHAAAHNDYIKARSDAHSSWFRRAAIVYGPTLGALGTGFGFGHWLGLGISSLATLGAASLAGRRVEEDPAAISEDREILALDPGMTPNTFARMVREALEGDLSIPVADIRAAGYTWGFEARISLFKKTPAMVQAKLDEFEACLSARPGSLLIEQSSAARNVMTLRALGSDPWRGVNEIPYRAPRSLSIRDLSSVGRCLDGSPVVLPLLRTNGVMVGGPGSGKSTALLDIAEVLTACEDVVVWDIDLGSAGAGLDPIGDAISRRATNARDAEILLRDGIAIAKARPKLFRKLGMGRNWEPSPSHPALVILIDEYPALVKAKLFGLVTEYIQVGRKAAANTIMAAQGASKDFLGSADPAAVPLRIALPCRPEDVTRLFNGGAIGEGWSAHRLRPAEGEDINDASVAYIRSGRHTSPIPYRFGWLSDDEAERRAAEREAAGLPELDEDTLTLAGVDVTVPMSGAIEQFDAGTGEDTQEYVDLDEIPTVAAVHAVFAAAGNPDRLTTSHITTALWQGDPKAFAAFADADGEFNALAASKELSRRIARELEDAGVEAELTPTQWKRGAQTGRGYLLDDVLAITGDVDDEDDDSEQDA